MVETHTLVLPINLLVHPGGSTLEGGPYARIAAAAEESSKDDEEVPSGIAGNGHLAGWHGPSKRAKNNTYITALGWQG